ncbi:hypothetical protein Cgig2_005125 [Carnegiea gigantea]|uniref:4-coumarate--CoA ligase n=1 Tax=Carnegiea gigantea TaxID=171969 RepID=A0A9Q1QJ76_9CARY|nr:hypothetical protein Cgig2_005125 [Carnegiea gigantea]
MDLLKHFRPNSPPLTPITFLERAATAYSDCPSIVYNTTSSTWENTHRRCVQVASSIASLGIKRGDVVSVLSPNVPAMYELHFSVPMAGAVLNTINTRLDPRTLSVLLRHSESRLVFVDHLLRPLLLQALSLFPPGTPRPLLVLIKDEDDEGVHPGIVGPMNGAAIPDHFDFVGEYKELVDGGDSRFEWVHPKSEWDPLALNYTSGTTNSPKGVVLSHRGYFILALDTLLDWSVPKQPVYLWTLPMFHANGWSLTWGMAAVGATNVCLRKFDAPTIYETIQEHRVTHMCGAPVVLNMLANMPNAKPLDNPAVLYTHPAVNEAAVVARPHEFWGETPCAFLSLKKDYKAAVNGGSGVTEKEVIEYCRERMAHYMVPRTVVFQEELPKTSTGKIQKFLLREMAKALSPIKATTLDNNSKIGA